MFNFHMYDSFEMRQCDSEYGYNMYIHGTLLSCTAKHVNNPRFVRCL